MIVFEKYQLLQKLVGLHSLGGRKSLFVHFAFLAVQFSFAVMETLMFLSNIHGDLFSAIIALSSMCGAMPALCSYVDLLLNRERYYSVLRDLQETVDDSECEDRFLCAQIAIKSNNNFQE